MHNTGHFLGQNLTNSSNNCKILAPYPRGTYTNLYSRFEMEKCITFPRSHTIDDLDMGILSVACA